MSTSTVAGGSSGGGTGGAGDNRIGGGSNGAPCGACKFLRRKCVTGCIFAPYFDSEQGAAHFAAVHKVFGASNVSKLLLNIPVNKRLDAVATICYEAEARLRDPVYGCVAHIFSLQQQVMNLQAELSYLHAHLATSEIPTPPRVPPPVMFPSPATSLSDFLPYDLSAIFEPMIDPPNNIYIRQPLDPRQFCIRVDPPEVQLVMPVTAGGGGGGDLQEVAGELLNSRSQESVTCRNDEPPPAPS